MDYTEKLQQKTSIDKKIAEISDGVRMALNEKQALVTEFLSNEDNLGKNVKKEFEGFGDTINKLSTILNVFAKLQQSSQSGFIANNVKMQEDFLSSLRTIQDMIKNDENLKHTLTSVQTGDGKKRQVFRLINNFGNMIDEFQNETDISKLQSLPLLNNFDLSTIGSEDLKHIYEAYQSPNQIVDVNGTTETLFDLVNNQYANKISDIIERATHQVKYAKEETHKTSNQILLELVNQVKDEKFSGKTEKEQKEIINQLFRLKSYADKVVEEYSQTPIDTNQGNYDKINQFIRLAKDIQKELDEQQEEEENKKKTDVDKFNNIQGFITNFFSTIYDEGTKGTVTDLNALNVVLTQGSFRGKINNLADEMNYANTSINDDSKGKKEKYDAIIQQQRAQVASKTSFDNKALTDISSYLKINPTDNDLFDVSNAQFANVVDNVRRKNVAFNNLTKDFFGNTSLTFRANENSSLLKPMMVGAYDVTKANREMLSQVSTNPISYALFTNDEDKQKLQELSQTVHQTVDKLNKILFAYSNLEQKPNEYYKLKDEKEALELQLHHIDDLQQSLNGFADTLRYLRIFKDKMLGLLAGGLSFLGIGAILHPLQMLHDVTEQAKQNGQMRYNIALTDTAFGANPSQSNIYDLSYYAPSHYFMATYGQIPYQTVSEMYRGFQSSIGGQYGNSPEANRRDMAWLSKNLVPDKVLLNVDSGNLQSFMKTFYRDMRMSAQDATIKLRSLETFAQNNGIPVNNLLQAFNSSNEAMRQLGMNQEKYLDAMTSLIGVNNMRMEDANALVQQTAHNTGTFAEDWSRNMFWGLWKNPEKSSFDVLLSGYKSHDRNGKPIDSYYDNLIDRMFAEQDFFGSRFGGIHTTMGQVSAFNKILEQGYTIKQAQEIVQLKEEGRNEELKEKLKGWDKLKNDPMALPHTTQEYTAQLHQAGEQLSEFTKIQATYKQFINNISFLLETTMSKELEIGLKALEKIIDTFTSVMVEIIRQIGGFFNSPLGKAYMNSFKSSPFLTIGGTLLGAVALRKGAGYLVKGGFNALKNVAMGKPSGISKAKVLGGGAVALLGAGGLAWNQYEGLQEQANKLGEKPPQNELAEMFANGTAKMQLIINPDKKDYTILKYASLLALAGVPIYLISRLLNKMSLKGKTKYANELKLLRHLSKNSNRQLKAFTNPRKTRRFAKLRQQLKEHKKLTRRKFQKYQRERKLYVQQIKKARAIQKHNQIIRARIQAKRKLAREKLAQHLKWSKRFKYAKRSGLLAIGAAFLTSLFDKDVRNSTIGSIDAGLAGAFIGGALGGTKGAILGGAIGAGASELLQTNDEKASQALASEMKQEAEMQKDDSLAGLVLDSPSKKQTETQQYKASHADEQSKKQSKQFNQYVNYKKAETEAYNKEKEMEIQRKTIDDSSEMINATNDLYTQEKRQSLESHGIQWGQVATHEKQIWQTTYENFLAVYQDRKMALEMAAKALIACKSMGGGSGINGAPTSFVEYGNRMLQSAPPEIRQMIKNAHDKYPNVPEFVIAAIAAHESGFQNVMNGQGSGATGMMQIMPGTAAGVGYGDTDRLLHDPQYNLMAGTAYVSTLASNYDSWAKTISAYSLGGGAIDGLIKKYGNDWYRHLEEADEASGVPGQTTNYLKSLGLMDENGNLKPENASSVSISPSVSSPPGAEYSGVSGVDFSHLKWSGYVANDGWNHDVPGGSAEYIALDINRLTPKAKQRLNALTQLYAKYSNGGSLQWTVATLGHNEGTAHATGRKIDIASGGVNEEALIKAGNEAHVGVDREDPYHYDLLLEGTGSNNLGPVITERFSWDDANSNGSQGANPKLNLNLNLEDIKPKTLKEQWDDSWKAYKKAVHNGKAKHGALVNGVYIDTSKPYQSIEAIGKEIREKNRKQWGGLEDYVKEKDKQSNFNGIKQQQEVLDHEDIQMKLTREQIDSNQIVNFVKDVKDALSALYEPSGFNVACVV